MKTKKRYGCGLLERLPLPASRPENMDEILSYDSYKKETAEAKEAPFISYYSIRHYRSLTIYSQLHIFALKSLLTTA